MLSPSKDTYTIHIGGIVEHRKTYEYTTPEKQLLTRTVARLAHLDLEGLVMDSRVRELRDQFVTLTWSRQLYQGM